MKKQKKGISDRVLWVRKPQTQVVKNKRAEKSRRECKNYRGDLAC